MAAADAFVESGLYKAGYRNFHLDDCWAGGRNESGYVYPEEAHFPNGMKRVVDYVHGKGLAFGLYTCGGTKTVRPCSPSPRRGDSVCTAMCLASPATTASQATLAALLRFLSHAHARYLPPPPVVVLACAAAAHGRTRLAPPPTVRRGAARVQRLLATGC